MRGNDWLRRMAAPEPQDSLSKFRYQNACPSQGEGREGVVRPRRSVTPSAWLGVTPVPFPSDNISEHILTLASASLFASLKSYLSKRISNTFGDTRAGWSPALLA